MRWLLLSLSLLVSFMMAAVGAVGATASAPPTASATPTDNFIVPSVTPTPIPDRDDVTSCLGETCDGTDPHKTGCDENGVETQTAVQVYDEQGNLLGTLELRGNHTFCDSTQWAKFTNLTRPLTFELKVVQNRTGLATETVRMEDWRVETWTMQIHSPDERVRAEVIVYDENGKVIASAVTESY